jgi:hypothetical protein
MRGIPTYTQYTVAFPTLVMHERDVVEEINVSFNAKGGGTHGEFRFVWYEFHRANGSPERALRVEAFTDGMAAMLDERLLSILRTLANRKVSLPEITPTQLIEKLEEVGVRPSTYQLQGLYEKSHGRPGFWPKEAQRQYEALRRHEGVR